MRYSSSTKELQQSASGYGWLDRDRYAVWSAPPPPSRCVCNSAQLPMSVFKRRRAQPVSLSTSLIFHWTIKRFISGLKSSSSTYRKRTCENRTATLAAPSVFTLLSAPMWLGPRSEQFHLSTFRAMLVRSPKIRVTSDEEFIW